MNRTSLHRFVWPNGRDAARVAGVARNRRGVIFIAALGVTIVLAGLLLVFAQEMRVEAIASANRLADVQAASVETAAEQWVLAQLEEETDAVILRDLNSEGLRVGPTDMPCGYFWIIRNDPDSTTDYAYGITDEASKLNINSATVDQLTKLPGMTTDIANAIVEWRGGSTTGSGGGAGSSYYSGLAEPYSVKNGNFESVDELTLIKDVTPSLLWGRDRNHDGVIDDAENAISTDTAASISGSGVDDDGRGIAQYLTAWTASTASSAAPPGQTPPGQSPPPVTTTTTLGKVNANTASRNVLIALGFTSTQADSIIGARASTGSQSGTQWIQQAASGAGQLLTQTTSTSQQFSADIVAVSADGRAYRRVKIVIEARSTPFQIIYRKDLTNNGWPLPREIRDNLRAGRGLEGLVSR